MRLILQLSHVRPSLIICVIFSSKLLIKPDTVTIGYNML